MAHPEQNTDAHESLGAELRRQREIREISLKEIADATKISRRYLEAIESGQNDVLPAPVFTRGFVREFARYIGLDAEEMADRYNASRAAAGGDDTTGEDAQTDSQPLPFIRVDRNIIVFIVLLVAFSGVVWWVWSHLGSSSREPVPKVASATVEPGVASTLDVPDEPTAPPETPAPDRLEMRVNVLDDTWVILHVDGKPSTNEVLRTGDVRTFSAEEVLRFEVIGNAGGLDLSLNSVPIPSLGVRGKVVRDVVFDWKYLKELREASTRNDT